MAMVDDPTLWNLRHFVWQRLAATGQPPKPLEAAEALGITTEQAEVAYRQLHERHALLLEPDTFNVRMANPFSGQVTDFRVRAGDVTYFANCAWDALGIPAALQADASIRAYCAASGRPIHLEVRAGQVSGDAALVHFAVPFAHWYDDLILT